jgi:hypothetical protein
MGNYISGLAQILDNHINGVLPQAEHDAFITCEGLSTLRLCAPISFSLKMEINNLGNIIRSHLKYLTQQQKVGQDIAQLFVHDNFAWVIWLAICSHQYVSEPPADVVTELLSFVPMGDYSWSLAVKTVIGALHNFGAANGDMSRMSKEERGYYAHTVAYLSEIPGIDLNLTEYALYEYVTVSSLDEDSA